MKQNRGAIYHHGQSGIGSPSSPYPKHCFEHKCESLVWEYEDWSQCNPRTSMPEKAVLRVLSTTMVPPLVDDGENGTVEKSGMNC